MVLVVWYWVEMVVVRGSCTGINLGRSVLVAAVSIGTAVHQFRHESNVGDGQSQGFDPGQPLLISKRWHLPTELIKSFIEIEHPPPFSDICSPSLSY